MLASMPRCRLTRARCDIERSKAQEPSVKQTPAQRRKANVPEFQDVVLVDRPPDDPRPPPSFKPWVFRHLYDNYDPEQTPLSFEDEVTALYDDMAEGAQLAAGSTVSREQYWTTPRLLARALRTAFTLTTERMSTAVNAFDLSERPFSARRRDTVFGCRFDAYLDHDASPSPLRRKWDDAFGVVNPEYSGQSPLTAIERAAEASRSDDPARNVLILNWSDPRVPKTVNRLGGAHVCTIKTDNFSFRDSHDWTGRVKTKGSVNRKHNIAIVVFDNAAARSAHPYHLAALKSWAHDVLRQGTSGVTWGSSFATAAAGLTEEQLLRASQAPHPWAEHPHPSIPPIPLEDWTDMTVLDHLAESRLRGGQTDYIAATQLTTFADTLADALRDLWAVSTSANAEHKAKDKEAHKLHLATLKQRRLQARRPSAPTPLSPPRRGYDPQIPPPPPPPAPAAPRQVQRAQQRPPPHPLSPSADIATKHHQETAIQDTRLRNASSGYSDKQAALDLFTRTAVRPSAPSARMQQLQDEVRMARQQMRDDLRRQQAQRSAQHQAAREVIRRARSGAGGRDPNLQLTLDRILASLITNAAPTIAQPPTCAPRTGTDSGNDRAEQGACTGKHQADRDPPLAATNNPGQPLVDTPRNAPDCREGSSNHPNVTRAADGHHPDVARRCPYCLQIYTGPTRTHTPDCTGDRGKDKRPLNYDDPPLDRDPNGVG